MARITRDNNVYAMSPENQPVIRVPVGSILQVETYDCFENQLRTPADRLESLDWHRVNPATGPIYVEGAEPGDLLKVEILSIDLADQAVIAVVPGAGALPDRIREPVIRVMPVMGGFIHFSDQGPAGLGRYARRHGRRRGLRGRCRNRGHRLAAGQRHQGP